MISEVDAVDDHFAQFSLPFPPLSDGAIAGSAALTDELSNRAQNIFSCNVKGLLS